MIVSTKGRYALRVMIDLAEHQSEKYVPLKEVAARQEISEKYLENILKVLVQNGFLEGLRGKGGGYRLTRSPSRKPFCTRTFRMFSRYFSEISCRAATSFSGT